MNYPAASCGELDPVEINSAAPTFSRNMTYGLILCVILCSLLSFRAYAAEADLKPGDTIGPSSWERVKGMVGDNLLDRIKQGYSFKIKEPTRYDVPREYVEATKRYSGKDRLGADGELLNYVAGRPFPQIET